MFVCVVVEWYRMPRQVAGVTRFRDRVYQLARRGADDEAELSPETLTILHKTMKKARKSYRSV